jgi:hypothetical protein
MSEVTKGPRLPMKLSDSANFYSANDMRLFHHFLIEAHPCVPLEYEKVWVTEIPAFSHQVTAASNARWYICLQTFSTNI